MEWVEITDSRDSLPKLNREVLCYVNDIINGWHEVLKLKQTVGGLKWRDNNGEEFPCIVTHWSYIEKVKP